MRPIRGDTMEAIPKPDQTPSKSRNAEKTLLVLLVIGLSFAILIREQPWKRPAIDWRTQFEPALAEAKANNKLLFVDFYASWCGPCKQMDQDTYSDPKAAKLLSNMVPVKVDIEERKDLANTYVMRGIPLECVMNPNGTVIKSFAGYLSTRELAKFLKQPDNGLIQSTSLFP